MTSCCAVCGEVLGCEGVPSDPQGHTVPGWCAQDGDEEEESPLGLFKQQTASSGEESGPEALIWSHRGPRWSKAVLGSVL